MIEEDRSRPSHGLSMEKYGPIAAGAACFLANSVWLRFVLTDQQDWTNRLIDRVIQATSVGVAFWGIAVTLFIGMESKPIVITLKKLGYFSLVVRYFCESLYATFLLLLLSVLLEPLSRHLWPMGWSSMWVALGVWCLLTTARTFLTLTRVLFRMT